MSIPSVPHYIDVRQMTCEKKQTCEQTDIVQRIHQSQYSHWMISKISAGYLHAGLFVACAGIPSAFDYSTHVTTLSKPGTALPSLSVRENLWKEISEHTLFRFTTTLHVPTQISVKKTVEAWLFFILIQCRNVTFESLFMPSQYQSLCTLMV